VVVVVVVVAVVVVVVVVVVAVAAIAYQFIGLIWYWPTLLRGGSESPPGRGKGNLYGP